MAADGSSGTLDGYGFLRGLGVAPGAKLIEQLYSPYYTFTDGMLLLMKDSSRNGAFLSGNSWGPSGSPLGYDDDTMQVDIGVRDANPDSAGHQPLTYVLSIMNGYGGTSSQGTPDEAKNIFTIGSTRMQTSGGQQILQIDDLSSNSAHGPARDGRTIPHMVAPGCYVDSTGTGSSYFMECGTSMASPHVSGAVALFVEYYRGLPDLVGDPSAALIKAAFVVVARDLAGNHDADGAIMGHPFDSKQGWGRMDLEAVVDPSVSVQYYDNPTVFDNTGEEWTMGLSRDDPSKPVRLMLVWTDAPGHGLGGSTPAWNNDLDLVVEVDGDTYKGNNFAATGWSQTGGSADGMNNTEGVFLGPVPPSDFTVRVLASDINSDAIPGEGDLTDQDFALVCYNCLEEAGFTLNATPNAQDICAPDDAVYSVEVGQILGFSDPVTLSVGGEPAGTTATFDINPVTPPGTSELTIGNTGAASGGTYNITVEGFAVPTTHTASVELRIADGVPGIVTLDAPANGATDVLFRPSFSWTGASQATSYT
ncbi:MAG: S8 family serine peptidase, partial [Planctomycetota bacterium]